MLGYLIKGFLSIVDVGAIVIYVSAVFLFIEIAGHNVVNLLL